MPVGPQAMLVEAIKELGIGIKEQAQASHNQVLAALAPLQAAAAFSPVPSPNGQMKCFRCGEPGHLSSASMMGLFVLPGVVDADFEGEIMIMVYTPFPPVTIQKGQRIAQAVPLPHMTEGITPIKDTPREMGGFGSTGGLTLLTLNLHERPR
uniref:dUTPase-like domain-containing protein n=1 Tax=Malurus cyaneus samueli TaxID=2593467 RepID=A0A8C5T730_9PASS